MEMSKLKQQLKTATRGHKLLKDKLDELMKQFLNIVRENKRLREEAEAALENAYKNFIIARAVLSESILGESLMIPQQTVAVKVGKKNIMSVNVPVFDFQSEEKTGDIYPYGLAFSSGELDSAMLSFSDAMEPLLRLAESEKTAQLLAQEIERTRRRVNALENVMIPNYQETIKYITMKLEENERGGTTRMMKVKDLVLKKALEEKKKREAGNVS
jgi:V/A-type H+-transporting ATPase subunit D